MPIIHTGRIGYLPASYIIWIEGNIYYARDCQTGALDSDASFDSLITRVINGLPDCTPTVGGGSAPTGKTGALYFKKGFYKPSSLITIPAGSVIALQGECNSGYCPVANVGEAYFGGTTIYSQDTQVLNLPKSPGGYPSTYLWLRDMELRVKNPVSYANIAAVNMDGWISGDIRNVNILSNYTAGVTRNVRFGLQMTGGASSTQKLIDNLHIYFFYSSGFNLNTTHITVDNLSIGGITGYSYANCLNLSNDIRQHFGTIQLFSSTYGILFSQNRHVHVNQAHFESVTTPVYRSSGSGTLRFRNVILDTGVSWTGDLADPTKCEVDSLFNEDALTKRARNNGVATITTGTNSITFAHNLITTPRIVLLGPTHAEVEDVRWTADANNITLTVTNNVTGNRNIAWEAKV